MKDFTEYKEASELKELGFDEPCYKTSEHKKRCEYHEQPGGCPLHNIHCGYPECTVDNSITPIPLPTYSQAFRWFDENTPFQGFIIPSIKEGNFDWEILNLDTEEKIQCDEYYQTRLEAELACLRKLIEIVKNGK